MTLSYQEVPSPVGQLFIVADEHNLQALCFAINWKKVRAGLGEIKEKSTMITRQTREQLREYFRGQRVTFSQPLALTGTRFQEAAWQALLAIPYGETRSYSQQAKSMGNPKAVRAIGHANTLNPIPIIVPCHRVIAKSGKLAGYAGGKDVKKFLLQLEGLSIDD